MHIVNGFPNNSNPLTCHCQSKDTDFGYHFLLVDEEFKWKFHANLIGKTLYFCHFYWGNLDKSVDVFNDNKRFPICDDDNYFRVGKCYWLVTDDGFYSCKYKCRSNHPADWNVVYYWD